MNKLKIAFLAHNLRAGGGLVGTLNLFKSLKNVSVNEKLFVIYPKGCGYEDIELPTDSEVFVYSGSHSPLQRVWFETISLPRIVGRFKPDVICGLGNIGLSNPRVRQAVFVHNPFVMYNKDDYPRMPFMFRLRTEALRRQIAKSAAKSNLIFCQTPVVKKRFAERFGYPEDKIRIVRWPPPMEVTVPTDSKPPPALDKSGGDFFLFIMTRYLPYRNPGILIPLCNKYAAEFRQHHIRFITNLDTERNKPSSEFVNEIHRRHFDDIVTNVGVLPREDVSKYLWNSNVLWLPTYIETLCLPFLEAMVLGVPVLAPDLDFTRYVCGEAAVFHTPGDIDSAFAKIMLLRQDSALRKSLVEKGRAQLQDKSIFSANWEEVAGDMLRELRQLAQQPNQGEAG
jgi:glycosyltransferase involved in cell wall biosynthesis